MGFNLRVEQLQNLCSLHIRMPPHTDNIMASEKEYDRVRNSFHLEGKIREEGVHKLGLEDRVGVAFQAEGTGRTSR